MNIHRVRPPAKQQTTRFVDPIPPVPATMQAKQTQLATGRLKRGSYPNSNHLSHTRLEEWKRCNDCQPMGKATFCILWETS